MKNGRDDYLGRSEFQEWKEEQRPNHERIKEMHSWVAEIRQDTQYLQHLEKLEFIDRSLKTLAWTLPILIGALCTIVILKELGTTDRNFRLGNILNMDKPVRD